MSKGMIGVVAAVGSILATNTPGWGAPQHGHHTSSESGPSQEHTTSSGEHKSSKDSADLGWVQEMLGALLKAIAHSADTSRRPAAPNHWRSFAVAETHAVGTRGTADHKVPIDQPPLGSQGDPVIDRQVGPTLPSSTVANRSLAAEPMVHRTVWSLDRRSFVSSSTTYVWYDDGSPWVMPWPLFGPTLVVGEDLFNGQAQRNCEVDLSLEDEGPRSSVLNTTPNPNQISPQLLVAQERLERLDSPLVRSRIGACRNLGRLKDPRAVLPLMDRLKLDKDHEVRRAAARALGMIGDPRAALYLQRASVYDRQPDVREAAKLGLLLLEAAKTSDAIVPAQSGTLPPARTASKISPVAATTKSSSAGPATEAELARSIDRSPTSGVIPVATREPPAAVPTPAAASQPSPKRDGPPAEAPPPGASPPQLEWPR
jgi:hypothetical protein